MIRVLHVVKGMNRGGLETFIMNVYRNINRNHIQFDFLVHINEEGKYDKEIKSLGGKIFCVPSRKQGYLKNKKMLNKFFREYPEYKIVHQHVSSLSYVEPLKVAKRNGVPIRCIHSHSTNTGGNPLNKYIHLWNQQFVKSFATHYFACSLSAAKWLYGQKQFNKEIYSIINNGIETDKFIFNKNIRDVKRKEFNIREDQFVIGHVGRFAYPKNHNFLIEVFKEVHNINPSTILLLVGDGELKHIIKEKVANLNLQDNVIFTGARTDIPELLQAMDVFVFPSHYEGFPVTLVEAQASGLKCIVSNNVTKEVEITNNLRWCELTENVSIWAKNILECKELNEARSNKKEEIIEAGFDITSVSKKLEGFYMNSIKNY